MKTAAIAILAIAALAGWILAANLNTHAYDRHEATVIAAGNYRCSMCDGTGFGPNGKGEKGKGNYKCIRCNGTGKI